MTECYNDFRNIQYKQTGLSSTQMVKDLKVQNGRKESENFTSTSIYQLNIISCDLV